MGMSLPLPFDLQRELGEEVEEGDKRRGRERYLFIIITYNRAAGLYVRVSA